MPCGILEILSPFLLCVILCVISPLLTYSLGLKLIIHVSLATSILAAVIPSWMSPLNPGDHDICHKMENLIALTHLIEATGPFRQRKNMSHVWWGGSLHVHIQRQGASCELHRWSWGLGTLRPYFYPCFYLCTIKNRSHYDLGKAIP